MAFSWNRWSRKLHRWGAVLTCIPLFLVIGSGILLQVKKQAVWIQPATIRGEGVTFIGRSLAVVAAHDWSRRVCMVNLNWSSRERWDSGVDNRLGIADVLRGDADLDDVIIPCTDPPLSIVPAGEANAREIAVLASSPELDRVLDELDRRFDHVVTDLPAVHTASESLTLAAHSDALIMVVRQGVTTEEQVRKGLEQLDGVPVLGVVLNDYATSVPGSIARRLPVT